MTKDELIAKQQLEIEEIKGRISEYENAVNAALRHLNRPEQWSTKCSDFPRVAMHGILQARDSLELIPTEEQN